MITVLIVDDSAFMRNAISSILEKDPDIKVIGTAKDGAEGVELVQKLNPDVVTMDVQMPRMNGLDALAQIMKTSPRPVLMVSSLTEEGAEETLKALDLGALDFIPKYNKGSNLDFFALEKEIVGKVKAVARKRFLIKAAHNTALGELSKPSTLSSSVADKVAPYIPRVNTNKSNVLTRDIVAIGVSTGGPPAVQKVLSALPADFPCCILIAQHMPASFTGAFAKRLDSICNITVKEAKTGDKIQAGFAYVAPGGRHIRVDMRGPLANLYVVDEPAGELYKPSVNVLMDSLSKSYGRKTLGVIMTGMGSDGTEGVKLLKAKGARIIAQNEASCVVYGMPKSIVDNGLADEVVDIEHISNAIMTGIYL